MISYASIYNDRDHNRDPDPDRDHDRDHDRDPDHFCFNPRTIPRLLSYSVRLDRTGRDVPRIAR